MPLITVIGRGHSGTRAISHTLSQSGVYMGSELNDSGDLIPPGDMYEACRILARYVTYKGGMKWDFSRMLTGQIDPLFKEHIYSYLSSVLKSSEENRGWKIPETTLAYPWISRMFPDIKYIFWVRDPRDCIIGEHLTDDLSDFGIPWDRTDDIRCMRAVSWKYQREIIKAVPLPKDHIKIRFEDFVLKQEQTLKRLEEFLGIPLVRIPVRTDSIGRFRNDGNKNCFDFFMEDIREEGYEI
jgi:hypothetical protein